ncbi:unnamed protein product [Lactuca saligna]|uniref:Uncharacterized protein n=1 Tax=Lactuca saligna TaxID=75948 RepID=A0AA35VV22_LACSI|nr:unnamed protein product [Lactuca saligna]
MADESKYKLVGKCEPNQGYNLSLQKLNLDFVCEVCGELLTLLLTWGGSQEAENQSNCHCQTLKISANRSPRNNHDDTVAIVSVLGKFKIKQNKLTGKDAEWLAVSSTDGKRFTFNLDEKLKVDRAMKVMEEINIEPMDSTGMQLKRKHAEIQPTDAEDDDEPRSASPVMYSKKSKYRKLDDYDTSNYNHSEADEYESDQEGYDMDDNCTYDPRDDFVKPNA